MVIEQLEHILGTTVNQQEFWTLAQNDERLWSVAGSLHGLPALCTPTVFEALANTIIEQQIAWRAARRAQRWLLEWADRSVEFAGERYYAYPTPQQIASATIETLKPLKITHRRINLLIDIAQQVSTGELDLEQIRDLSHEAAYDFLLRIKGVGHWTAAVTISRVMGRNMYIGDNDVALQAAANRYFLGGKGRISRQQVVEIFAPYGEHAGLVAFYTLARWVLDEY
jgi:DNA-3-methyladenine glycosylase II